MAAPSTGGQYWRLAMWGMAATLVLLPAVTMQFTDEVRWGPEDFAVAAFLLGGVCLGFEAATRATASNTYRAATALTLATALLLVWINLAVGLIGSEDNPANLIYGAVLAVLAGGTIAARLKPRAMSRALVAAALAQVGIAVATQATGWGSTWAITAMFVAPWSVAAWLFGRAARKGTSTQSST